MSGMSFEGVDCVDNVLGFGNCRSGDLWADFGEGFKDLVLVEAIKRGIKVECVLYVDDFLWCVRRSQVPQLLEIIRALEKRLGMPFDQAKQEGPAYALSFLGFWLDARRRHIELTPQRIAESTSLVQSWLQPSHASTPFAYGRSELASLAGSLTFTARAVRNARTFVRRIYDHLSDVNAARHFRGDLRRLPAEFRADLEWWAAYLPQAHLRPVLMVSPDWDWDVDVIHTDAAPSIGAGAVLVRAPSRSGLPSPPASWFSHEWQDDERISFARSRSVSANYAESLAAILAFRTWGATLGGRRVLLRSDNVVTVTAWNAGYCADPHLMSIVRELWFLATRYQISIRVAHIAGVDNVDADEFSRGRHSGCDRAEPRPSRA